MNLNPSINYTSPKGREYKVVKIEKVKGTEKWFNRVLKYHWDITIKFLDGGSNILTYDYNDNLINKR